MPESTQAREFIPEEWSRGTVCPVCGMSTLAIDHQPGEADQILCKQCTTAFEVSKDGFFIRLVAYPSILPEGLGERWLRPFEVRSMAVEGIEARQKREEAARHETPVTRPPDVQELVERGEGLLALGNSVEKIREILHHVPGVTPEMREEAMAKLAKSPSRPRESAWLTIGILVVIVLILVVGVGALFFGRNLQASVGIPTATQAALIDPAALPAPIQTLLPKGARIVQPPPVKVISGEQAGPPATGCPRSNAEAAALFGGKAADWRPGQGGWIIVSVDLLTLKVPANMSAGVFTMEGVPEMRNILGPATLENVNFVAISCN